MLKLCIFDLDGTLLNTLVDLANSTNHALERHGFPLRTLDEYRVFVSDGLPKLIQRALGENYTPEVAQLLIADFNDYYRQHYRDNTNFYPGILAMLQELCSRGVNLAVVSNKPEDFLQMVIATMFPPHTFILAVGQNSHFALKPDPAALLYVLQTLGIRSEEAIYVGDSGVDILTAHNAGIKVIGVSWGFRDRSLLEAAGADYIVSHPLEILNIVRPEQEILP